MERKELSKTLFTKAFETQHNAFLWVALTQRLASIGARETQNVAACCRNVRS
ncbi:hypothetical protein [Leptospira noguchii]|uniref:Uncharacterized protein n=1 Tax=Leptospira noguchii TaxID=28182 RepID=A0AAE9GA61_9LEPT|nr:hypothetical protein [Leptospira noguchii]UOG30152.1 hypothetical protein MAL06_16415 [Leptospira noguchii]UOG53316.1 hypothetical protein MAL09_03800 [Leptospira noguchii]UOG56271.1 hypothetical protein MAL03_15885 [Leptospira noguchii]